MDNIAIFYHIYQFGDWKKIFEDQILKLQTSGLYDAADYIFIGVNGVKEAMPFHLDKANKIIYHKPEQHSTEYCTLKALYDYCNLKKSKVLFLHTKGVSWTSPEEQNNIINLSAGQFSIKQINENNQYWRQYMEYFNITKWKNCINLLDNHDIVGTEWKEFSIIQNIHYNSPHYAGGIWWANSEYIKSLDANYITNNMIIERYAMELWIGTNKPKHYNFYNSNRNPYLFPIKREEYGHI